MTRIFTEAASSWTPMIEFMTSVLSVKSVVKILTIVAIILPSVVRAGCGLSWAEPRSHFEGVDHQGNVMFVERLGEIAAGTKPGTTGSSKEAKPLTLPIFAIFNSNSANNSPFAGVGWTVPLLESRLVQIDEDSFRLDKPDGWFRMFYRDKKNPAILDSGNWKAEIRGDTITAWASCGVKLVYRKGRIVGMEVEGRKFDWIYEGTDVTEIREGNTPLLRVERGPGGEVAGLLLTGDKRIALERGDRPRVEVINGLNLVGGIDKSLTKYIRSDGTTKTFEYGVDENRNPTMNRGERQLAWNPVTRKIVRDGEWTYDIKPGTGPFDNAAIGRKNAKNQSEFWHRDNGKGEEIIERVDASKQITSWFTSGVLVGLLRQSALIEKGRNPDVKFAATYNEKRNPLRIVIGSYVVHYDNDGVVTSVLRKSGEPLWLQNNEHDN